MRGLSSWMVKRIGEISGDTYPMIEPIGQARAKIGNAMAWLVESVISPNAE